MNKVKSFTYRHPLIMSMLAIVVFTVFTEAINLKPVFLNILGSQRAAYLSGTLVQGTASILLVILIASLGLLRNAGFTKPKQWKQLWLVWPVIILSVLVGWPFFSGTIHLDTSQPLVIIFYMLVYLSTGFYEEILCRGFMLTGMLRKWGTTQKGIYLAVITSSMLFGLIHLISLLFGRITLMASLTQVLYATFMGVFFAACVLRNNSIWPAIICHALFNICSDFNAIAVNGSFGQVSTTNTTLADALSTIIVFLPLFIYGLFILRKVKPNTLSLNDTDINTALQKF